MNVISEIWIKGDYPLTSFTSVFFCWKIQIEIDVVNISYIRSMFL